MLTRKNHKGCCRGLVDASCRALPVGLDEDRAMSDSRRWSNRRRYGKASQPERSVSRRSLGPRGHVAHCCAVNQRRNVVCPSLKGWAHAAIDEFCGWRIVVAIADTGTGMAQNSIENRAIDPDALQPRTAGCACVVQMDVICACLIAYTADGPSDAEWVKMRVLRAGMKETHGRHPGLQAPRHVRRVRLLGCSTVPVWRGRSLCAPFLPRPLRECCDDTPQIARGDPRKTERGGIDSQSVAFL